MSFAGTSNTLSIAEDIALAFIRKAFSDTGPVILSSPLGSFMHHGANAMTVGGLLGNLDLRTLIRPYGRPEIYDHLMHTTPPYKGLSAQEEKEITKVIEKAGEKIG